MLDDGYEVQDSATFTVSAAGTVSSVAKVLGWGAGKVNAELVVDVTAIEIASNNEYYDIVMQGSTSSSFAGTITALAALKLGANEVLSGDVDSTIGRYKLPFTNEQDSVVYPYGRIYFALGGSVSTGITLSAYVKPED